jgi:Ca2+:H+ antiporter
MLATDQLSFMLREGHIRLVLASLLGSIFVNLLFILGVAIMSGGYHHREQQYNKKATQMLACFMNMGVLCILVPVSHILLALPQHRTATI